ncbi:hypothetical protein N7492_000867 [Penicillium capsulatum]|uniref:Uncharacterized protein n=1 Tax=Penicillium capsulatum TaxID=69766 RepID=A0A9W9LYY1_9EURO|nr:hypothetical protein N7492_000867 [Penicillium capsulatum]KAJ6130078.1 hypothetical protein N7512_002858 [Penicillium capsulatum]
MLLYPNHSGIKVLSPLRPVANQEDIPCDSLFTNERPYLDPPDIMCKVRLSCAGSPHAYHCLLSLTARAKHLTFCGAKNIEQDDKISYCDNQFLRIQPDEDNDVPEDGPVSFQTSTIGARYIVKLKITIRGRTKRIDMTGVSNEPYLPCSRLFTMKARLRRGSTGCKVNLACKGNPAAYKCLLSDNTRQGQELSYCGSPDLDSDKIPYCDPKVLGVKQYGDEKTHKSKIIRYKTTIIGKSQDSMVSIYLLQEKVKYRQLMLKAELDGNEQQVPCDQLYSKPTQQPNPRDCRVELYCAGNLHPSTCLVTQPGTRVLHHCGPEPRDEFEICNLQHLEIGGGEDTRADSGQEDCDGDIDMTEAPGPWDHDQPNDYVVHLRSPPTDSDSRGFLFIDPLGAINYLQGTGASHINPWHPMCWELPQHDPGFYPPSTGCQAAVGCLDDTLEAKYIGCRLIQEGDLWGVDRCQFAVIEGLPWCNFNDDGFKAGGF